MPIQTSADLFETPNKARAGGSVQLRKLIKTSRTAWVCLIKSASSLNLRSLILPELRKPIGKVVCDRARMDVRFWG